MNEVYVSYNGTLYVPYIAVYMFHGYTGTLYVAYMNALPMAEYLVQEARKVQYFPEGSLLNTMIISIVDSEKRYTDILKEPYTVYLIETK